MLFELLSLMCNNIHLNSLEPAVRSDLTTAMCVLLRPIIACRDVQPLNCGFMRMLEDLSLSFPADLHLLAAVASLMPQQLQEAEQHQEASASATIIAEFLENLSWFCCSSADAELGAILELEDCDADSDREARRCRLSEPYWAYRGVSLDRGTDGYVLGDRAVLAVSYSAWNVVAAEAQLLAELVASRAAAYPAQRRQQLERLTVLVDFLAVALRSDIQSEIVVDIFQQELWPLVESDAVLVDGCEPLLAKLIELAGLVLAGAVTRPPIIGDEQTQLQLVSRIVEVRNLFPHSQVSTDK